MQCEAEYNRCGSAHINNGEVNAYERGCISEESCEQAEAYCQESGRCNIKCCDTDLCNVGDLESAGSGYSGFGLMEDVDVDMKHIFH